MGSSAEDIASAVHDLVAAWRSEIDPALKTAVTDGSLASEDDIEPFFFFARAFTR